MSSSEIERPGGGNASVPKPASLGDLAKKISGRTTDFLAICIVLVSSLTLGSQIVSWWQAPPPPVIPAADPALVAPGWEDSLQPVDLEFGDLPLALTRQIVVGDRQAAVEALVRHCQASAERAAPPEGEADDAETRLLNRIAELTPAAEGPGAWQVFVVDDRFPLVAGVRLSPVAELARVREDGKKGGQAGSLSQRVTKVSDQGGRRLVCYGLAMPAGERNWTLFIVKGSPASRHSPGTSEDVPLPPGAARTLSLRDERGGLLLGFAGKGTPNSWMTFYDECCAARDWTRSGSWSAGNESWSARYARQEGGWVDVRFATDRSGELTGLLQVIPNSSEPIPQIEQKETRP